MRFFQSFTSFAILSVVSSAAAATGHLVVENAWIRSAPPGVHMLAGYATLKNIGDAPVVVTGAESDAFGRASLHATVTKDGMEHMQALGEVSIAAGQSFVLAPGGNHLMLMMPKHDLREGDAISVRFTTKDGAGAAASLRVRAEPPK